MAAEPLEIRIKGRTITLPAFRNGVAKSGFHSLCHQPLGPGDYLEIARQTRVLVLEDIPRLSRRNFNEAKRFVTLIDALYEAKVRLICSAAAARTCSMSKGKAALNLSGRLRASWKCKTRIGARRLTPTGSGVAPLGFENIPGKIERAADQNAALRGLVCQVRQGGVDI